MLDTLVQYLLKSEVKDTAHVLSVHRLMILKYVLDIREFQSLVRTENGLAKPVMIMTGGRRPDENPLYQQELIL